MNRGLAAVRAIIGNVAVCGADECSHYDCRLVREANDWVNTKLEGHGQVAAPASGRQARGPGGE